MMLIGCLTSSGKYLKHSQDKNEFNNIERKKIYRNDGGMWQPWQLLFTATGYGCGFMLCGV
jgi:hypothetical protein